MLINTLQSLTCDYVGCILNTCQNIKIQYFATSVQRLFAFLLYFDSSRKIRPKYLFFFQCNKTVYTECFQGDEICHVYFYFNLAGCIRAGDWSLQSTDYHMNLLTNSITGIHLQFTAFLHVHKDYLFWDSTNIPLICFIFMWYLYAS